MTDPTEAARRQLIAEINSQPRTREELEQVYDQVWDTEQLAADFTVQAFTAPFILATRKSDGQKVTLMFQHSPRFYFDVANAE